MLGIPSAVPYLEIVAYAGYPFVHASIGILVRLMGIWPYRAWWAYGSLATAVFMVRTMKRIIFHESRQYSASLLVAQAFIHKFIYLGTGFKRMPQVSTPRGIITCSLGWPSSNFHLLPGWPSHPKRRWQLVYVCVTSDYIFKQEFGLAMCRSHPSHNFIHRLSHTL